MQHNLFDVYGSVAVIPNVEVFGEWARSFQDLNRLSPLDAEDDAGSAYEAGVRVSPIELWERIEVIGKHTSEHQSRGHLVCRLLLEKQMDEVEMVPLVKD